MSVLCVLGTCRHVREADDQCDPAPPHGVRDGERSRYPYHHRVTFGIAFFGLSSVARGPNNFGVMPSVDSDSHLPLERLRCTVHSAIIGESPMHGKPSYLPLERLRSAGADKERVLAIGAIPIFLYHGSDSRATVGHT